MTMSSRAKRTPHLRFRWWQACAVTIVTLSVLAVRVPGSVAAASCPANEAALQALINEGGTVTLSCPAATTIPFTSTITILGAGTRNVTLDASKSPGRITFDGGGSVQLFSVDDTAGLSLNGLTLAHGRTSDFGGAIQSRGTVTVANSTLSANSASAGAGAIYSTGALAVANTTLSDNSSHNGSNGIGGAILNDGGTLTIANSTLSQNSADGFGGAVAGNSSIANSTLSGNSAGMGGAIAGGGTITNSTLAGNSGHEGGGTIFNGGTLTIANSTVSGSATNGTVGAEGAAIVTLGGSSAGGTTRVSASVLSAGGGMVCGNLNGGRVADTGYNLEDDPGASCGFTSSKHDLVGQSPQLGALNDNGGPTETMALAFGSPAVDAIPTATGLCPANDQRGVQRPDAHESACDIGAYEYQESCPSSDTALRALIGSGGTVTLSCPAPTTVRFTSAVVTTQNVTLDASNSPGSITIDGGGSVQLFVNFGALTLNGLQLAGGHANTGGAIYNEGSGTLTINNTTLSDNSAGDSGGAIWNGGTVSIANSTLSANTAANSGGAIANPVSGAITITNSTLTGNSANDGGAIANDTAASIVNSTLAGNSAYQGAAISDTGTLSVSGTIVADSSGEDCFSSGGLQDSGYNLEDDSQASCGFSQSSNDIIGKSAQLARLTNNGGDTPTMALMAGSPAIDQIPTATGPCPATDQRGATRPDGNENVCDMGAFESGATQLQQRPPAQLKLITCKTVTKTVTPKAGHKTQVKAIKCTAKRVSGKVKLRGGGRALAKISRGPAVYAIGTNVSTGKGGTRLLVTQLRPLQRGRYTLTLRHRHHRRWIVQRITIRLG